MTVAELIEHLKGAPQDAHVKMSIEDSCWEDVDAVCWWEREDGEKFLELS